MRMISGSVLILAAEQAFAHAHLIGFPHHVFAHEVLIPVSITLLLVGVGLLIWGVITERK